MILNEFFDMLVTER
jgi:hypothetical protein